MAAKSDPCPEGAGSKHVDRRRLAVSEPLATGGVDLAA